MIWRAWDCEKDKNAILRISREPMGGTVALRWGLTTLQCPPECQNLRGYSIELQGDVQGCAATWDWPDGSRYLNGLRFSQHMSTRPRPAFWKEAFASILSGTDYAWSSIGSDNVKARRMLESHHHCLPHYQIQQNIVTWFVPLSRKQREAKPCANRFRVSTHTSRLALCCYCCGEWLSLLHRAHTEFVRVTWYTKARRTHSYCLLPSSGK